MILNNLIEAKILFSTAFINSNEIETRHFRFQVVSIGVFLYNFALFVQ